MTPNELAGYIDHTLLRPDATAADVERLCAEARQFRFRSVSVHGSRVAIAAHLLEESGISVGCAVGFPFGANAGDVKRFEAETAVDDGAGEIDVVLNIAQLKEKADRHVLRELRDVVEAAEGRPVKVILETALLTNDEKIRACHLAIEAEASFVQTSTGFGPAGATVDNVRLLRQAVGPDFGVKESGGIRDAALALAMIGAGANRLGTSASIGIINGLDV
jgi:deoxyribose-phosphate aldolase